MVNFIIWCCFICTMCKCARVRTAKATMCNWNCKSLQQADPLHPHPPILNLKSISLSFLRTKVRLRSTFVWTHLLGESQLLTWLMWLWLICFLNASWPFLVPPDPRGVSGGVQGGQGGSLGPKIVTFLGATFGFQIGKFWIVWTENTLFSRFLAKNGPSGEQKWSFLGWNGWTQKCIFLKNTLFKLPENAP